MKITKILSSMLLLVAVFMISGCNNTDVTKQDKPSAGVTTNTDKPADDTLEIKVYFPNNDASKLVAEKKKVKLKGATKYRAAMDALLAGTDDRKLTTVIPKDAKVLGVTVTGDTAKVDFNKAMVDKLSGGSTGEEMLVGSIVNTLTEFPEIKKVQIVIEGRKVETLKGHMDTSQPITRMEELLK